MWKYSLNWPARPRALALAVHAVHAVICGAALLAVGLRAAQGAAPAYTLSDCLDLAGRQNADVLAAAKRVDAAKAAVMQARASVFPALTSSAYYQRRDRSIASNADLNPTYRQDDYIADARLTQNVYSAGAVRSRIAAAELQAQAEALTYKAALDTAALAVRTAFYQTLYAEELIPVRQQAVDLLNAQVQDQQDRLTAGSVAQINVNRAKVSLVNEEPALESARFSLHSAYVQLSQVLAIPAAESTGEIPFRIKGALAYVPMKVSLNDCLRQAESARPEIASRQLAVDALRRLIVAEKSGTRPQVNAFAAYDLYSEPDRRAEKDNFYGYTIGVSATWQIFDGFLTLGKVRGARAQVGIAEALLASTRLQVQADVRTAFYERQQAEATLRPQAENIRLANENRELTSKNFDAGLSSQLEVLQSRVDLTTAQTTELAGRVAYNTAMAKLWRAIGVNRLVPAAASRSLPAGGK